MGSLQDALLKTGLASEDQKGSGRRSKGKGGGGRKGSAGSRSGLPGDDARASKKPGNGSKGRKSARGASDLERAWAARRRAEQAEKERSKKARVADQEARRKRNLELDGIVEGKALNVDEAEIPRYFEHLGRIRRVLCTAEQRDAINRGELGVVSLRGRYLIVAPEVLERYRAVAPDLVPDLSGAEPEEDQTGEYPPVPEDLTW